METGFRSLFDEDLRIGLEFFFVTLQNIDVVYYFERVSRRHSQETLNNDAIATVQERRRSGLKGDCFLLLDDDVLRQLVVVLRFQQLALSSLLSLGSLSSLLSEPASNLNIFNIFNIFNFIRLRDR